MKKKIFYQMFNGMIFKRSDIERAFYISTGKDAYDHENEFLRYLDSRFTKSIKCAIPLNVIDLLVYHEKIEAIKLFREEHPECSLIEAKEAIDKLSKELIEKGASK